MRLDRRFALVLLPLLALASPAVRADGVPHVGTAAPAFTVKNSDGRDVSLAAMRGKTVVLEWTNPACPYVAKHYDSGSMQALQAEARNRDIVWLTISSAAPGQMGYVDDLEAGALLDQRKSSPAHFLLDHDHRMLKLYGVAVALTMVVIAPDGTLAYYGAIDDKPTAKIDDVAGARNYVRAALDALARGDVPSPARTRPYGCVPG